MKGTGSGEFKEGVLHRQTRAIGLSESTQKTVMLLKSTFKLKYHLQIVSKYLSAHPSAAAVDCGQSEMTKEYMNNGKLQA